MKDEAHKLTDDILNDLIDDIDKIYSDIQKELYRELEKGLDWDKINSITDKKKRLLEAKKRKRLEMMIERVAKIIQSKNEIAAALIQDKEIDIFALNYNWGGYYVEHTTGVNIAFTVMNRRAIEELLKQTTPVFTKMAYLGLKDRREIIRDLRRELTKAITRGESIGEIAKRIDKVTNKNNYGSKRIAQTETTRIESAGREKAFKEGEDAGLNLKKEWISTIDKRTRESHRRLMGKKVGLDDKFGNGLKYPGDPMGKAAEVINCRCTHIVDFVGFNKSKEELELDERLKKISFEEWQKTKEDKVKKESKTKKKVEKKESDKPQKKKEQTIKKPITKKQTTKPEKEIKPIDKYTRKDLEKLSNKQLKEIARKVGGEYYSSGAINLGGRDPKKVLDTLLSQDRSKTSLIKDIMSMQKRIKGGK